MKKEHLLFLIIPASQLLMLAGVLSGRHSLDFWGYGGIVLSLAADALLLYVLLWGSRREKLKRELQELSYLQEAQRIQNEMMEAQQKQIISMRAEFEKQLKQIQEEFSQGEDEAVRRKMDAFQEQLDLTRPSDYCQNALVNAVLSEKMKEFQRLDVKTEIYTLIPRDLQIEPIHLCSLFSNLLDNALEALAELPESQRRMRLDAEMKGAYMLVKARNTAEREHALRKRRKGRGYGTQILQELAKNYEGNYQAAYERGWYTAAVMVKAG